MKQSEKLIDKLTKLDDDMMSGNVTRKKAAESRRINSTILRDASLTLQHAIHFDEKKPVRFFSEIESN